MMLRKYLTIAWRFMMRNKFSSFINIIGLSVSLSAFILIILYISTELAYDKGHKDYERIYRITEKIKSDNYLENSSSCPLAMGETILEEYPDFLDGQVRFFDFQVSKVAIELENGEMFTEKQIYFTDPSVFQMLDFTLTAGNPETILSLPLTAVISEELANKYFKGENPVGKTFKYEGNIGTFEVVGTYKQGSTSHIKTKMLLSMESLQKIAPHVKDNWVWNPAWTYIKLKPAVSPESFEKEQLPAMIKKYFPERVQNMSTCYLQPIADIHLFSSLEFEMGMNSDIKYIYIFASCAFFLLLIACVNFINLTTATSLRRAREIGIRKVFGANLAQLRAQFFTETVFISLLAFFIAFILCMVAAPVIGKLAGIAFNWELLSDPVISLIFIITILLVGFISGVFPAFFISSLPPVSVMKGLVSGNKKSKRLRQVLVVLQFTIAIVLITFTYVAVQQLNYMKNKDYGFRVNNMLLLKSSRTPIPFRIEEFKKELLKNPAITSISIMNEEIGINNNNHEFGHEGLAEGQWNYYPALMVDEDFVTTFDLKVIAGHDYEDRQMREDSLSILINRSMAKVLGFSNPDEAIGKRLNSLSGREKIKGVVEDFHYKSFHSSIGPMVLDIENRRGAFYYFAKNVAIQVDDVTPELLSYIEGVWGDFVKDKPFEYRLLDEELFKMYKSEDEMSRVLLLFSLLTILIACLGLFSLAYFIARHKTREISIRKVLGASFTQLFIVGYKEQFILVVASFVLSIPIGLLLVRKWLSGFAYHTDIDPMSFILSGVLAIVISAITVFAIFFRTIQRDPAEVLRHE